jgi:hypothetical protein
VPFWERYLGRVLKIRSNHYSEHLGTPGHIGVSREREVWLVVSWAGKENSGREMAILPKCLWKFSQTKHLAFAGRELRSLKLLAGRWTVTMSNSGDLKKITFQSSETPTTVYALDSVATTGGLREVEGQMGQSKGSWQEVGCRKKMPRLRRPHPILP